MFYNLPIKGDFMRNLLFLLLLIFIPMTASANHSVSLGGQSHILLARYNFPLHKVDTHHVCYSHRTLLRNSSNGLRVKYHNCHRAYQPCSRKGAQQFGYYSNIVAARSAVSVCQRAHVVLE